MCKIQDVVSNLDFDFEADKKQVISNKSSQN